LQKLNKITRKTTFYENYQNFQLFSLFSLFLTEYLKLLTERRALLKMARFLHEILFKRHDLRLLVDLRLKPAKLRLEISQLKAKTSQF